MRKALIFIALAAALLASIWGETCASQPGGCIVTPQSDEGLGMDPDGKPGS